MWDITMTIEQQIEYLDTHCPFYTYHTSKGPTRHDFFREINTEIQAYLLGFYAADGTITGSYVKPNLKWKKNENFRSYVSIKYTQKL